LFQQTKPQQNVSTNSLDLLLTEPSLAVLPFQNLFG
jgi:hypothetical protein